MNKNRMNGTIDQVVGTAKRKAGSLTSNTKLEVAGIVQQAKGKVESAFGSAQDAVGEAIAKTELHLDGHVTLGLKNSSAKAAFTMKTVPSAPAQSTAKK